MTRRQIAQALRSADEWRSNRAYLLRLSLAGMAMPRELRLPTLQLWLQLQTEYLAHLQAVKDQMEADGRAWGEAWVMNMDDIARVL